MTEEAPVHKSPESLSLENFRAHTRLRHAYAEAVSRVKGIPFTEALYSYTDMYRRLNLGAPPKADTKRDRLWHELETRLAAGEDLAEAAWSLRKATIPRAEGDDFIEHEEMFGPFRYDYYAPEHAVQLHFGTFNAAMTLDRPEEMRGALVRMFQHIKKHHPEAKTVFGRSWLYGRLLGDEKFATLARALFPESFIDSARPSPGKFQGGGRWHQFRAKDGSVNQTRARHFLAALKYLDPDHLEAAFPIQPLRLHGPISDFYSFLRPATSQ